MYKFHAGLSRLAKFEPIDNHHYLDIIQYVAGDRAPTVKRGTLKHEEIRPWLEREVSEAWQHLFITQD
jgi:hypothetical protein